MARSDTGVGNGAGSQPPARTAMAKQSSEQVHASDTLARGTLIAAALCVFMAQFALTVPAGLNGLFQQDFHTSASELTWITDAFLVPVTVLELTFGLLGDLFGRRRLLVGGSLLVAVGFVVCALTPGRSAGGFRLMNNRSLFTEAFQPDAPTDDPTWATAGSDSTILVARCCNSFIASNEMSGAARVPPKIRPVSSRGK